MNPNIKFCTAENIQQALAGVEGCQLVDVREAAELDVLQVTNAMHVPLSRLEQAAAAIDPNRPIYLLCRSGARAGKAAERLAALGCTDLHVIQGGIDAWAAAGLPLQRGAGRVWSLERQVRFSAGLLVLTGILLSTVSTWLLWLSGLVGVGLMVSATTDTCTMGMLLAKMPWNQRSRNPSC